MPSINERQWQGRVLQWTSELLKKYPELPFSKVDQEFEVLVDGKTRRFNDLTLFDKQGKPACIFELKLPDRSDGRSPRYLPVVTKTYNSADSVGAEYFVNLECEQRSSLENSYPRQAKIRTALVGG